MTHSIATMAASLGLDVEHMDFAKLQSLRKEIDAIHERRLKHERDGALKEIIRLTLAFGFTAPELNRALTEATKVAGHAAPKRPPVPAKYRNPATAETWTGRGQPPAWIKDAADRTPFLIEEQDRLAAQIQGRPQDPPAPAAEPVRPTLGLALTPNTETQAALADAAAGKTYPVDLENLTESILAPDPVEEKMVAQSPLTFTSDSDEEQPQQMAASMA